MLAFATFFPCLLFSLGLFLLEFTAEGLATGRAGREQGEKEEEK
jgi:hypothetical protein